MRLRYRLLGGVILGIFTACSGDPEGGDGNTIGSGGTNGGGGSSTGGSSSGGSSTGGTLNVDGGGCQPKTCADLGWACGHALDGCGNVIDCGEEGLACGDSEVCIGGVDGPTECTKGSVGTCEVCSAIPDCSEEPEVTRLTGRVVSPGRDDNDTANQVGVPNAIVYILRNNEAAELPPITTGIPSGGTSCDRCEDENVGPVLAGAVTDATGNFTLEGSIPVGTEFLMVVKAGKFRRAVKHTLPESAACETTTLPTTLPDNPTRLPRSMSDGIAVNIPRIAVSTGQIDAMECVFEKMGIAHEEFGNPGDDGSGAARVHLYRGGEGGPAGARIDNETPSDSELYTDLDRLQNYDMVVADCEGPSWDGDSSQRIASGANLREYVNRGGRMFLSHLSFSWLEDNGNQAYDADDPFNTGLNPAASWAGSLDTSSNTGTGIISVNRDDASPRIQNFADWMVSEGVTTAPDYEFTINEPRSQTTGLGEASEEFVYRGDGNERVQQFSFNTPYGAPDEQACGRVAYSGFHVFGDGDTNAYLNATFPDHCEGDLTDQEKVLLYMLFDLGACVGDNPPPPPCVPVTCESAGATCGFVADGCGNVLECGECPSTSVCVANACSNIH